MRDILLSLFIFGSLPFIFWKPHVGVLMWAWISMMNPHRLTYGFAFQFSFAAIVAAVTLVVALFTRDRNSFPWNSIVCVYVVVILWICVTTAFATGPSEEVMEAWVRVLKIHLMLLVTLVLIRKRAQLDQLIWVIVFSIGFYGVKGGIWTIFTGGQERVWGPPGGVIEGNNELALALVMAVPLMYYLMTNTSRRWVKYLLIGAMIACGFSILGSFSRGAFLAVSASVLFLALKSRRPLLMIIPLLAAFAGMVAFMPDHWTDRMNTISEHEDSSSQSRLTTWSTIWLMTLDHPILGGGFAFNSTDFYLHYLPSDATAYTAHSIYFQAMAEHGFVGLFLFLFLFAVAWIRAGRIASESAGVPDMLWVPGLMRMVQVSLFGFGVGGAFLGVLHFDLPYYLVALVIWVDAAVKAKRAQTAVSRRAVPRSVPGWSR